MPSLHICPYHTTVPCIPTFPHLFPARPVQQVWSGWRLAG
ncbi:hypothetical protein E2C01_076896 [Portunus trituberculatus]|uniref:Uncharacterized protein n=1 Tax=Portunus trituberculatus TaxID=210409 RepID=A0A5B7IIX4_PORTR|nr:hypothetical protein [Portunus trituberculatus]